MARTDLSSLLGKIEIDETVVAQQPSTSTAPSGDAKPATSRPKKNSSAPAQEPSQGTRRTEPLYLQMVRKETRLREDQYERLTEYARKLNRAKTAGPGERITENTLIRIAVDLLIPHLGEMGGNDEGELRESVSNRV
ncbi:MAG: hypothetical protein ABI130_09390 [Leifsonia sp.]